MGAGEVDGETSTPCASPTRSTPPSASSTPRTTTAPATASGSSRRALSAPRRRRGSRRSSPRRSIDGERSLTTTDRDLPMTYDAIREAAKAACAGCRRTTSTSTCSITASTTSDSAAERPRDIARAPRRRRADRARYGWSTDDPARARVFASARTLHRLAVEHRLNLIYDAPELLDVCEELDLASICNEPAAERHADRQVHGRSRRSPRTMARHRARLRLRSRRHAPRADRRATTRGRARRPIHSRRRALPCDPDAQASRAIPIPGFKTVAQVDENVGALEAAPAQRGSDGVRRERVSAASRRSRTSAVAAAAAGPRSVGKSTAAGSTAVSQYGQICHSASSGALQFTHACFSFVVQTGTDEEVGADLRPADRAVEVAAREPLLHRLDLELALAHVLEVLRRAEEHVDERADDTAASVRG